MSSRSWRICTTLFALSICLFLFWKRRTELGGVLELAVSPDGVWVAAAHSNGRISLWDSATRQRKDIIRSNSWTMEGVAVSPDARWIASFQREGNEKGAVRVWTTDGNETACLTDCYPHSSIAFHPNRPVLAWVTADYSIALWDAEARREIRRLASKRAWSSALTFTPDGRQIALGVIELKVEPVLKNTVVLWDVDEDRLALELKGLVDFPWDVAVSPRGDRVAAVAGDVLRVWDVATRSVIQSVDDLSCNSSSVSFSPDGSKVTAGMGDGTVQEFDILSGRVTGDWRKSEDERGSFRIARYDPRGRFLAHSAGADIVFIPLALSR